MWVTFQSLNSVSSCKEFSSRSKAFSTCSSVIINTNQVSHFIFYVFLYIYLICKVSALSRLRLGFALASISCEHCRSSRNNPHCAPKHVIYYYVFLYIYLIYKVFKILTMRFDNKRIIFCARSRWLKQFFCSKFIFRIIIMTP